MFNMQNSAGGQTILVVHSLPMRRVIAIIGLLFVGGFAIQTSRATEFDPIFGFYRPELFASVDTTSLLRELSMTDYLEARLPGSTALGRMGSATVANFPTALVRSEPRSKANVASGPVVDPKDGKDYSSVESMAVEKASLSWTGGEVGFYYGHASGRFGGDEVGSYIIGSAGNDHMQINVGAGYEETHFSRSRR